MRTVYALGVTFLWVTVASAVETFMLDCGSYPDICDNHVNGITCNGLPTKLHYDAKSSDNNKDDKRRSAIGCGSGNYCKGKGDCDEFPYASTFEGGLSCFSRKDDGYDSSDTIDPAFLAGVTRCADSSQNSKHGNALKQFYKNSLNNKNSAALCVPFSISWFTCADWAFSSDIVLPYSNIGFKDGKQGPLADKIKKNGKDKGCPDESTGDYRHATTPQKGAQCPARASKRDDIPERFLAKRSDAELVARFVTTETGITGILPYRHGDNDSHAEVGRAVWTTNGEGNLIRDIIVSSEEL